MKDLYIDSMIELPVEYLGSNYKQLLDSLTVPNPEYKNASFFGKGFVKKGIPKNLHFFSLDERSKTLLIPRNIFPKFFDISYYNTIYNYNINTNELLLSPSEAPKPRDYQKEFLDQKVYPYLNAHKDSVFCDILINAPCGAGKTVMAMLIAKHYGYRTLVCVTTKKIGKQFIDTVKSLFKGWSVGWEDGKSEYDITVGTYSLLSGENYGEDYFAKFPHYVYDEYHRCGATTYMAILEKSVGKYRTSLTATPRRKDGLYKVLQMHAGEVLVMDRNETPANIYPLKTGISLDEWRYRTVDRIGTKPDKVEVYTEVCLKDMKSREEVARGFITDVKYKDQDEPYFKLKRFDNDVIETYVFGTVSVHSLGTISITTIDTDISMIPERNDVVLEIIRKLRSEGRNIIVLSKRKEQLYTLDRLLRRRGVKSGVIISDKDATYKEYCGKLNFTPLDMSEYSFNEANVLLGIDKLAEEGMDAPRFDTLIYLHPIKDIEQSIGRVLREVAGKKHPVGVFLIDKITPYHNAYFGKNGAEKEFERLGHNTFNAVTLEDFKNISQL